MARPAALFAERSRNAPSDGAYWQWKEHDWRPADFGKQSWSFDQPYDEKRPVICFDESSKALRGHESDPLPTEPGAVARVDHRYKRNGKQWLHLATEPLTGWVTVETTEQRRTTEWIDRMVELADVHYPDADCIRVVVDNLNIHKPAGFYQFSRQQKPEHILTDSSFTTFPRRGVG